MLLAKIMIEGWGDKLALPSDLEQGWRDPETGLYDARFPPSPDQLKYKIFVKGKISQLRGSRASSRLKP